MEYLVLNWTFLLNVSHKNKLHNVHSWLIYQCLPERGQINCIHSLNDLPFSIMSTWHLHIWNILKSFYAHSVPLHKKVISSLSIGTRIFIVFIFQMFIFFSLCVFFPSFRKINSTTQSAKVRMSLI